MTITLETDVAAFLDTLHSSNTRATYTRSLRRFTTFAVHGGIADYRAPQTGEMAGFLETLHAEGLAASSRSLTITAAKMFYRWLVRQGRLTTSAARPVTALTTPALPQRLPRVLTVDEVRRLLEAPRPTRWLFLRDKALLEFLYATGCRASEATGLRVDDLDLDTATARVLGKGSKERIVLLGAPAVQALYSYIVLLRPDLACRQAAPLPWVFLSGNGKRLTREYVWTLVNGYARQVGLPAWVGAHSLRHAASTHLLQGGADVRFTQEILGHANAETTTIYLHLDISHLRRAHERFDEYRWQRGEAPAPLEGCPTLPADDDENLAVRRFRRRQWREEDCQLVRTLSRKEAAQRLGISLTAVDWMRRVLGVVKHRRWTAQEDQLVGTLPTDEAARRTGRTPYAVACHRRHLRRIGRGESVPDGFAD